MKRIVENKSIPVIEIKDIDFAKGIIVVGNDGAFRGLVVNDDGICYIINHQGARCNAGHPFGVLMASPEYKFYQLEL